MRLAATKCCQSCLVVLTLHSCRRQVTTAIQTIHLAPEAPPLVPAWALVQVAVQMQPPVATLAPLMLLLMLAAAAAASAAQEWEQVGLRQLRLLAHCHRCWPALALPSACTAGGLPISSMFSNTLEKLTIVS